MHRPSPPIALLPVLVAKGLVFSHGQPPGAPLFNGLSLELPPGVTWVGGDEGSGKTTLLQLLAGVLEPNAWQGQLRIHDLKLTDDPKAYRCQVAWLDPRGTARDQQTARQIFAELPHTYACCSPNALQAHIAGLSLAPHLDKALYMLSSGSRRKVLMAAAMATMAPVTLLDQPFMALDSPSTLYLLQVLADAARQRLQAWVVADYEAPPGIALAGTALLGG